MATGSSGGAGKRDRPLKWVRDRAALEEMVGDLRAAGRIALDMEANGFHRYFERVCLIQISVPDFDVLIDPLVSDGIEPLGELLADPDLPVLMHGADYDVISFRRDFGFEIRGLFDTMIAARLLGRTAVSLQALLRDDLGIEVDKGSQRADWTVRPLPDELVQYARGDTAHLAELVDLLEAALREAGRLEAAREEFEIVQGREAKSEDRFGEQGWQKDSSIRTLTDPQRGAFRALWAWRDRHARRRDLPPFRVLPTQVLVQMAQRPPRSTRELGRFGVRSRTAREVGDEILEALGRAEPVSMPSRTGADREERPEKDEQSRYDRLRKWRKGAARKRGLDPGVLIANALLKEIARASPQSAEAMVALPEVRRWQVAELGAEILAVLAED